MSPASTARRTVNTRGEDAWEEWADAARGGASGGEPPGLITSQVESEEESGEDAAGGGARRDKAGRPKVASLGEAVRNGLLAGVRPRLWTHGTYEEWGAALGNYSRQVAMFGAAGARADLWVHVLLPQGVEKRTRRCVTLQEAERLSEWWARRDMTPGVALSPGAACGDRAMRAASASALALADKGELDEAVQALANLFDFFPADDEFLLRSPLGSTVDAKIGGRHEGWARAIALRTRLWARASSQAWIAPATARSPTRFWRPYPPPRAARDRSGTFRARRSSASRPRCARKSPGSRRTAGNV
ncbi:hypothetical protein T484DRAFT_1887096 [Baffinella frigidus]|nr:hypothetical protein T484DRAFT_1887096 [Cryptophyta sp. CCMP2293]